MAKDEENKLEKLKKEYDKIQKKYKLPSYKELNEDFGIEKLSETDTELLTRELRKFVGDYLSRVLRTIESLLSPSNVPMFVFSIVKSIDAEDKKKLSDMYKELAKSEVKFIKLDFGFNEEKEAEFVKDSYNVWQTTKKDFLKIMEKVDMKWDDKAETNNKGYFG